MGIVLVFEVIEMGSRVSCDQGEYLPRGNSSWDRRLHSNPGMTGEGDSCRDLCSEHRKQKVGSQEVDNIGGYHVGTFSAYLADEEENLQ